MDYNITIPLEEITVDQVRFFYMPMIDNLCKIQKELKRGK
jgi:hypothetical protein